MLKQLANMTTEKLIEMFELTTNMNDENIPTVRGWLMDEIEKRNPDGFDKWLDSEQHMKERHAQILEAIKSFCQENGFCPTIRQIGDMVGLKSTSTVITHLKAMEKAGLIIRNEFSPRSIIIPGFNDRKPENDNVFGKIETENTGFEPVFVLHGFWITGDDAGVDVFAVSPDPEYLRERMREEAEELLAGFQNSGTTFEVENIEETGTKYEVEGKYGDMVKLYITEHEVEGDKKSGKQHFIPENEKGC